MDTSIPVMVLVSLARFQRAKHGRQFAAAMVVAAAAIAILLFGTSVLDWRW